MPKLIDMTGRRFGKLVAIKPIRKLSGNVMRVFWECRCDCGGSKEVDASSLRSLHTRSCGCITIEKLKKKSTHGLSGHRIYRTWYDVRNRCNNPKYKYYADYGGRGITYDPRWEKFENFFSDMGMPPEPDYVLVRIDTDVDFKKDNCKWVSKKEQHNYKIRNRRLTFRGITKNLAQWEAETGINQRALSKRLRRGWSVEKTLTEYVNRPKKLIESEPCLNALPYGIKTVKSLPDVGKNETSVYESK